MALVSRASCFNTTTSITLSPEFCRLSSLQLPARFPSPKGFCGFENECLTRRRRRSGVSASSSSRRKTGEVNGAFEQNISLRLKKEGYHGNGITRDTRRSSSTAIQTLDVRKKDKGGSLIDTDERQAERKTFKDGIYLDSIVKVFDTRVKLDYSRPWQKRRQGTSSASAFAIGDKKLLTNAHCVKQGTQVLATGLDCDLALLSVENKEFWNGVEPLVFGKLPQLQGDVIASFNGIRLGWEGSVPFRNSERIEFGYLISQKFSGDVVELGIIRDGAFMKVQTTLGPRVHLVPLHIENGRPSYLIVLGFIFTPLSMPLIYEKDDIGLKLKAKAYYSLARFKGEQIVILSQVLTNERNVAYEDMSNQQVLKFNGTKIKNIRHLAHLVDTCEDKYRVFEFEDKFLAVLERESVMSASSSILKDYGIPSERFTDLLGPYVDILCENNAPEMEVGDSPVFNTDRPFWA